VTAAGELSSTESRRARGAIVIAIVVGTALRIALAAISEGTNDVLIWQHIARRVRDVGFLNGYRGDPLMNHPPLPVLWAVVAFAFENWFSFVMKLPAIAADAVACAVLARSWLARGDVRSARSATVSLSPPQTSSRRN
jgi:hypothetical protein